MKTEIRDHYSVVVIGAGPAGMAAAQELAAQNIEVAVFDEQHHSGGQIYRHILNSPLDDPGVLGKAYIQGRSLAERFTESKIHYFPSASVWYCDNSRIMGIVIQGKNYQVSADKIIIATGAQERPVPIPGWELPGVMSAGAGQILMKSAAMIPSDGVVLAGSGPLLLLLATQYLDAGVIISAIVDTTSRFAFRSAIGNLPWAIPGMDYLLKGAGLIFRIKRAKIPFFKHATDLKLHGDKQLNGISFSSGGSDHFLESRLVFLHQGVISQLHLAQAADCKAVWNPAQQCWNAEIDEWGQSSVPGIFVVGDGAKIMGAQASAAHGYLSALQVSHELGVLDESRRNRLSSPIRRKYRRHTAVRPFLDSFYTVSREYLIPDDETMVCRCEEVTAGEIKKLVGLGCMGPNQAKAFSRCGMGPCQGRMCGSIVEQIISATGGRSMEQTGRYRSRPPVKPITLGQLSAQGSDKPEL
jgi:NADPH-dependent 2,4-dienoyl-CoA reductase/sulfur reductase-like enzyme